MELKLYSDLKDSVHEELHPLHGPVKNIRRHFLHLQLIK